MLTRDAVITVLPFTQQREGEDIIIGRVETGVFLAVPPEAVEILDDLSKGKTIGAVTDSYNLKYGEIPDLEDLLTFLEAKGIVSTIAVENHSEDHPSPHKSPARRVHYHFSTFPASIAQRIFSKSTLLACLVLIVVSGCLCVKHPELLPRARDLYFPDERTISWIVLLIANYTTLFVHEFAHLVAARALGVNSRIGISHRLWYLVAETDLTGLWSVPKEKRYLPMLAGILVDITSLCSLLLVVYMNKFYWTLFPNHVVRVMRAMAFTYLMRLAWQCLLYVRTDLYYVIAAFFNCKSLMRDTETFLRNHLSSLLPRIRKVDQSSIPVAERKVIRAYAALWIAGRISAVALLCAVTIPIGILYIRSLANAFRTGFRAAPSNFVDAVLLAAYFMIPTLAGFVLWFRSILRQERT
jgi:putative peptide zinc metalloprotease protein